MEYLFLKHRYTNPSFPNNKVNGWEERYERVNSSSYSSWHESVSRKRLHVTWNVLNSFGSDKDTSSDAVWNDTRNKVINCSQSTEVFPFCSGAEVCSLLTVSRSQTRDKFSWAGSVLRGWRHFYLVYWGRLGLFVRKMDSSNNLMLQFWCLLLFKWCSVSKHTFLEPLEVLFCTFLLGYPYVGVKMISLRERVKVKPDRVTGAWVWWLSVMKANDFSFSSVLKFVWVNLWIAITRYIVRHGGGQSSRDLDGIDTLSQATQPGHLEQN